MAASTAGQGHNVGTGREGLKARVESFRERAGKHAEQPVTEATASIVSDLRAEAQALRKEIDEARMAEKRPVIQAGREIDAAYGMMTDGVEQLETPLKKRLGAFIEEQERAKRAAAEKARRDAEAAAEAEAAKKAAEAKGEEVDPFDAHAVHAGAEEAAAKAAEAEKAAGERVKVAGFESARAASMRTYYDVRVTDAAALVLHYATRADVVEAATKIARAEVRAAKGEAVIPGVEVLIDRRVS